MANRTKNLTMEQGADFVYTTKLYASKVATATQTIEVGDTANSQMRKSYYHANAVATFGIDYNISDDTVTMFLRGDGNGTHLGTANISPGRYVYDLEYVDADGDSATNYFGNDNKLKYRALEGIITVAPEVTKIPR